MADYLELLNNSSLREQCIKFGLPNVPVTDSSRKVLIRKLRTSMGNSGLSNSHVQSELVKSKKSNPVLLKDNFQKPYRLEKSQGPPICQTKTIENVDYVKSSKSEIFSKSKKQKSQQEHSSLVKDHDSLIHFRHPKSEDLFTYHQANPISTFNHSNILMASDMASYPEKNAQHQNGSNIERAGPKTTSTNKYNIVSKNGSITSNSSRKHTQGYEDGLMRTPYLSNFARTLERLKIDQLGTATPNDPMHTKKEIYLRRANCGSIDRCETVGHTFYQFLFALDRKYHLKRNLTIAIFFFAAVFIYVFFIM